MRNLVIMPAMANNRERMNLGEFAEEATNYHGRTCKTCQPFH